MKKVEAEQSPQELVSKRELSSLERVHQIEFGVFNSSGKVWFEVLRLVRLGSGTI